MPQKISIAVSKDPDQIKLRQAKKGWNLAARTFVQKLIAWKKGFNGHGDPKVFSIPPSDIKEPMPDGVSAAAREIETNFQQLMSAASQIEEEQATYSAKKQQQMQEREQRKAKQVEQPPMEKPASIRSIIKKASLNQKTGRVVIGDKEFDALLLTSFEEHSRGLMYVPPPAPTAVFLYRRAQVNYFWMKNTISPLDIVFALNGKVIGIHKGEPYSTATIGGHYSDLVVELNEGTCKSLGIKEGDSIKLLANDNH